MKQCFKCLELKPLSEFYRHPQMADGHLNKCKECNKKDVTANYRRNISQYAAYEQQRARTTERRQKALEYQSARRRRNPEVYKAYLLVWNALRKGTLVKQPCQVCGDKKAEAHHPDYSKPLDVMWLCRKHHLEEHGKQHYAELGEASHA